MTRNPGSTSVESQSEYPHAPFPDVDAGLERTDTKPNGENPQQNSRIFTILLHFVAVIPTTVLILFHQHQAVLVSGLIAAFPALFMATVNSTIARRSSQFESFWKKPYTVFLVGFTVIATGLLLVEGLPKYQDAKQFYSAVESIQQQIDSGDKDAVQKLAYLYLNKESPIPYPYTHLTLRTKGAALLEEWVTSKIQMGEGNRYAEHMYNLAKSVAWHDKQKANRWLANARRHGHTATTQKLEQSQSDFALQSNTQLDNATLAYQSENAEPDQSPRGHTKDNKEEPGDNLGLYDPDNLHQGNIRNAFVESEQPSAQPTHTETPLGAAYQESLSISPDGDNDSQSYRIASKQDSNHVQSDPARMVSQSQTMRWSADEAAQWYRQAAEGGDANAQSNLGWMYFQGQGVSQNYQEAVQWFRMAAEQGDAPAQSNLGWMYETGTGIPQDNEHAVYWYGKAADQGYAAAQSNLGAMYGNGKGVARNDVLAHMWSDLAAMQDYPQGAENRRRIAVKMTSWQIHEAQRLAREWMEAHKK